jgi:carboxypeptidase Q
MHFSIPGLRRSGALCLTLSLLAALASVQAQNAGTPDEFRDAARRMIAYERDSSDVMTNLEYLSDIIGPRLTGSERLKRANDWTAAKMREYGLANVHLEPYTIPHGWERGPVEARIVQNGLPIAAAQMAWTPGTHGKITGPVVLFAPRTEADFAAYKGKLHNAIVLTSDTSRTPTLPGAAPPPGIPALSQPAAAPEEPPSPTERRLSNTREFQALRQKRNAFLKQEGAAVILQDSGKPHDLLNMTGSWTSNTTIPTLFVAHEHIAMLQRLLKRKMPVTLEVRIDSRFTHGPLTVYNTVGEIRGSERPDEVVLLGAHLDSWDLGTGTTDNGTGSMAVLEAAKLIKSSGIAPKRTLRFVLFSGEEEGLNGSKAYVEAHKAEMPNMDVVFVHDTGTGRVKGAWLQGREADRPLLESQFALLKDLGLMTDAPTLLPGKMNGTDHASFDAAGVPAFAFNQDPAEYSLTHHSQSDTFDKVRPDDLKQGACVLAIFGLSAAQMPERYPRDAAPPTETRTNPRL